MSPAFAGGFGTTGPPGPPHGSLSNTTQSLLYSYAFLRVCLTMCTHACMLNHFSHVWLFATLWTIACQAPLPMGFSRQDYWSGLSFPSPRDIPHPGIVPACSALTGIFFTTEPLGKPTGHVILLIIIITIIIVNSHWILPRCYKLNSLRFSLGKII